MDRQAAIIMSQSKNLGLGIVLAIFFGGLGLLYSSIVGGILVSIAELIVWILAVVTLGLGAFLVPFVHVVAAIWAVIAIQSHNQRLIAAVTHAPPAA